MQTNTARGMQTMEQALADLVLRGVVTREVALTRSGKAEQLDALLARGGMVSTPAASVEAAPIGGLRAAGA
jgi:twitching motility protein PilT